MFCSLFQIDTAECAKSIDEYPSLGEFFVRDLKEGARPIEEGIVSPVDGAIALSGVVEEDTVFQAKGKPYSLSELIDSKDAASYFLDGYYITLYLAPRDYHHVHMPCDGQLLSLTHCPGTLWPVNNWAINNIDAVFVGTSEL